MKRAPRRALGRAFLKRAFQLGLRALVVLSALAVVGLLVFSATPATTWVDPTRFARPHDAFTILDRHGEVIRNARVDGIDRRWVALTDVSPRLVQAIVLTEDARFREHGGVDFPSVGRAFITTLLPWGKRSGASTITQQLVKLVYGRPYGAFSKLGEIVRAAALEKLFTKDEILEQYVNRLPYGDRIEGVARATESYFGHSVADVSVAEAALLAAVPNAPTTTEPRRHLARALARRGHVLERLHTAGVIDAATADAANRETPAILDALARPNDAPRFADAVIARARDGRILREHGVVHTSLDLDLQRATDAALRDAVARFGARGVTNGAAVVVANATGEILAYVGAARRSLEASGASLDLLTRRRQPGSTLKPFAYELLFERGGTAATVLDDIALSRTGAQGAMFEAKDYDGRERGPVRARVALSGSLNLAALDAAARVGQEPLVARLRALGFHHVDEASHYGAAAVLGGLDVAPLDLARAYVTLARGGTHVPFAYAEAEARDADHGERVLDAAATDVTRDILADGRARESAFGADLVALAGGPFALKTGTSSGFRDAWSAAFDDALTVVVWLGDPAGNALGSVSGFEAAAPVAARVLEKARSRALANHTITMPRTRTPLVPVTVCAHTGLRPGASCAHLVEERFAPGTVPVETCDAHDEHGDLRLPDRYADWIRRTHPPGVSDKRLASAPADVVIHEPRDGAHWLLDPSRGELTVPLRASLADVAWEVDGTRLASASWRVALGEHTVVAIADGRKSKPSRVRVDSAR